MSKNIYRTAQGRPIDMDALRVSNEETIAVGNMKTNARGDELGPGGIVVRTRNEVVNDYYQSNAVYTKEKVEDQRRQTQNARSGNAPVADEVPAMLDPVIEQADAEMTDKPKLRGTLADAVAKTANVEQKILQPRRRGDGLKRI